MKKIILCIVLVVFGLSLFAGRSATPHPVYIELHDSEGNIPSADSLQVKCWLSHKPESVLDLENSNLLFPIRDVFLQIQCSGFNSWGAGDILHVEILDKKTLEYLNLDLELTFENFQLFDSKNLMKKETEE